MPQDRFSARVLVSVLLVLSLILWIPSAVRAQEGPSGDQNPGGDAVFGGGEADDDGDVVPAVPEPGPDYPAYPTPTYPPAVPSVREVPVPTYRFDPETARPLARPAQFDRIQDTPGFTNSTTSVSTLGTCFGVNLATVDWFKHIARPLLAGEQNPRGLAIEGEARRMREYTRTREGARELAAWSAQFQDDQHAIQGAYSAEAWSEYMERFPEEEREAIWQLYTGHDPLPGRAMRERLLADIQDEDRQVSMVAIWGYEPPPLPKPEPWSESPVHPEDRELQDRIDRLEAEMAAAEEELAAQQKRRWEEQYGGGGFGQGADQPAEGAPPGSALFGGRGYPSAGFGDIGHSLIVFGATRGEAITKDGHRESVTRFRFVDPNRVETFENAGMLSERNHLLYFERADRWALSYTFLTSEFQADGDRWHRVVEAPTGVAVPAPGDGDFGVDPAGEVFGSGGDPVPGGDQAPGGDQVPGGDPVPGGDQAPGGDEVDPGEWPADPYGPGPVQEPVERKVVFEPFLEPRALEYSRIHDRVFTVARQIQNRGQGNVRERLSPVQLDFPRGQGEELPPRETYEPPIPDPVGGDEDEPELPLPRSMEPSPHYGGYAPNGGGS